MVQEADFKAYAPHIEKGASRTNKYVFTTSDRTCL